jgi:hypothetical protein
VYQGDEWPVTIRKNGRAIEKEWDQRETKAWRGYLEETQLLGARDRLAAPADAQLVIDLAIVPLDGVDREVELLGDLAV